MFKPVSYRIGFILLFLIVASNYFFAAQQSDSLVIGEFEIDKIIDGDTFRLKGLDRSTRLLGIDTEETYKDKNAEEKTNIVDQSWPDIYYTERLKSNRPVKIESPFGYKTWQWTKELFRDVVRVRLEKENNSRSIDMYGRYLVYVICIKNDGSEFNYNIESVKNGVSPYYAKYGYSKRFHEELLSAQDFAKVNKLGIWSGNEHCYPDYEERIQWWNRRGDAIELFENKYKGIDNYFGIYDDTEFDRLQDFIGKEVIIFGSISEILKKKEPYLLRMFSGKDKIFDAVIYKENEDIMPYLESLDGEYVYIKGRLDVFENKLEIKLENKDQVWVE